MTVRRIVATMRAAALLTGMQMNPRSTNLDALLALTSFRLFNSGDLSDVGAALIRHDVRSLPKHLMNKGYGDRSLADRGCDTFDVAAAHVSNREYARPAGFEQMRRSFERPLCICEIVGRQVRSGFHKTLARRGRGSRPTSRCSGRRPS